MTIANNTNEVDWIYLLFFRFTFFSLIYNTQYINVVMEICFRLFSCAFYSRYKKSLCVEDEQKTHKNTFFEEKNREKKE